MNNCFLGEWKQRVSAEGKAFSANLIINDIKKSTQISDEVCWLTDGFINGPDQNIFTISSKREMVKMYKRQRVSLDNNPNEYKIKRIENNGRDFILIDINNPKFLVTLVPDAVVDPIWSKRLELKLRRLQMAMPDVQFRY